jgi:hypothetical protein
MSLRFNFAKYCRVFVIGPFFRSFEGWSYTEGTNILVIQYLHMLTDEILVYFPFTMANRIFTFEKSPDE